MAFARDLREFLASLEQQGKLHRFTRPINKETELYPLFRVQQRGLADEERKVLLFENVVGAKGNQYDMRVLAGVYGASEHILALGLGCTTFEECLETWHQGYVHPIDPVMVDQAPVQEVVLTGDVLKRTGLDIFPVPVEEPGFSGALRTGVPMVTRDPETGVRNVGTYNGFFRARDRLQAAISPGAHAMSHHWKTARERKEGLPVAIIIGCTPSVMLAGCSGIPYGFDEYAFAGGMAGAPVELVKCVSVPLEVPAYAEAVIEGIISTEIVEPRLPFGEYPGYIHVDLNSRPVLQVTAITHRHDAMFTPVLVGYSPSDTSVTQNFCGDARAYHDLKYGRGFPVAEVYSAELGGATAFRTIRMAEGASPEQARAVFDQQVNTRSSKYTVLVDHDINVHDPGMVLWAMSYRTANRDDFAVGSAHYSGLDPSSAPTGSGHGKMDSSMGREHARMVINATRKWPYPPVALPKREYMERALQIWAEDEALPTPRMRQPWYGYTLGYWTDELQAYADLIVQGEYLKVGEEVEELQGPVTDDMMDLTPRT